MKMYECVQLSTLFLFSFLLSKANSESSLRLVNLVYRHGDRSPAVIFPTDPNQADKWPDGFGWLTQLGMQQQYFLGGWLRRRYVDTGYLSRDYNNEELYVYSSDAPRCLMSAYSNLAGMFPPGPDRLFNDTLKWQPIPVHTRPVPEDNMLAFGEACPHYTEVANESFYFTEVQKEERENQHFYEWLEIKTGLDHMDINNIWQIADTLLCEKIHNLTLAPWVNDTVFDKLMFLINYQFTRFFETPELQRLTGGPLLSEFIENIKHKVKKTDPAKVKIYMYSAHDGTVAALLSALQVFNGIRPPYNAMVISELHQNASGHYYVNLFYKNTSFTEDLEELIMPNCSKNCPLGRFLELTKPVVPVDWSKECAVTSSTSSVSGTWGNVSSAGIWCFACNDVTSLGYCDRIKRCKQDETCYASRSRTVDGRLRFSSGCIPQQICTSENSGDTQNPCLHCCSSNYCNQAGCGDQGFQDRRNRGPLCLDCTSTGNAEECDTVKLCASDQACHIEEYAWGENKRLYKLGCQDKLLCATDTNVHTNGSAPLCSSCCDEDFCNRNCTG